MRIRSYAHMISLAMVIWCGLSSESFSEKCSQEKIALHRGFQYPDYSNTYAAIQLFSISDIGRTTFNVKKPISMVLSRPADFEPECELNSSPMLKIKASGASLDFNGFEIKKVSKNKQGDYLSYGVGIEVGYSPAELAADPTLEQVQNVVIKNGGLSNFEIGIVIHAGVKNVIVEDFYVSRSPLGILLLGQDTNQISSCMFKHVRITGDFQDDSLILQWAKVKVEQTDVSSIDSANGGTTLLQGKPGFPAAGYGYGTSYCFMQLQHNPVSNADDAYTYYGMFLKNCVNIMLDNVMTKCIGYQEDAHDVVAPGATVGSVTNPSTSAVSINGDVIAGQVTPTVTKGISITDSSTIFLKCCEAVNCVSALSTYGLFVQLSSSLSIQDSAFSTNDAHHVTTGVTSQAITDADVRLDTSIVDAKTGATINSLYNTLCVDILGLPLTTPPLIDPTIEPFRDAILDHKAAIEAGISLSEMLFHVEQIIINAQGIISAYNALVLAGTTPTSDDSTAHLQASAMVSSGSDLFNHLFHSVYRSGRFCYGLFFNTTSVVEIQDVISNYNKAEHYVAGMCAQQSDVISMKSVACNHNVSDNIGDDSVTPVPQAANSHAHGVILTNTDTVTITDLRANYNQSFGLSSGFYGYNMDSCKVCGVSCTNNEAIHATLQQGYVRGLCLFDGTSCTFVDVNANANRARRLSHGMHISCVSSSEFECAHADNNSSDETNVVGAYFDRCHSLGLQDISATSNSASLRAYGMLFESCSAVNINGAAADDNAVDRSNSLATDCYGLWWNNPESCFLKHVSGSNNRGRTLGVGLYAKDTRTFHVEQADFCTNSATEYVDGETTRCNDASNASKFFSRDYPSGALGMYFLESCDVSLQEVTACKNFAHRAAGIFALKSSDFVLCNCITSFQAATGNYFIDDPFKLDDADPLNDILFCEFPIPLTQYSTLFGSPELEDPLSPGTIISADQINLLQAICCFLRSVALIPGTMGDEFAIKNRIICNIKDCSNPCDPCAGSYCVDKKFAASWLLIQVAMAKYRLFGGAVGLHMHDCDGFAVKNHFSNGNTATKDNAAGIACTGTNKNHIFDGDRTINNDGWTESELGAIVAGRYDLSAVKPFYDALYATTTGTLTDDFDIGPGTQLLPRLDRFCTDIINKKLIEYFKISLDCSCPGGSGTPEDFWFTSPVGGMGVGILLGDCAEHIEVRNLDCANNKGYSGFAFGLLQDVCANDNIDSNRFYQNSVNVLGLCFGIADITTQSTSIIMRNFMFCNRIGDYLNFNYFVPYNPSDPFGLFFPVKTAFNGDFSTLVLAGAYDNIEIKFVKPAPQNPCVPDYIGSRDPTMPDMPSCWEDAGFLDTSGTTITSAFQQCIDDLTAIAPATGGLLQTFVNEIITAVLSSPAGPAAITAGRDAGVTAGLLEVVAFPAATIANVNRAMPLATLQELVCQEIFTQLNNDVVLLMTQEALSVLIPRKRSHIPGLNHFAARVAAMQVGQNKGVLTSQAESVATVVTAFLEHCPDSGADAAVYAGRDIFAVTGALIHTTRELIDNDIVRAQQVLAAQGVIPDSNAQVQDAIERHVAVRLTRGLSDSDAVSTVTDATRGYATIISDFIASHTTFSAAALEIGLKIIDSFFDFEYAWTLNNAIQQKIKEDAVTTAANTTMEFFDDAGLSEQSVFLCGAYSSIFVQSIQFRNPVTDLGSLGPVVMSAALAGKNVLFNALMDIESNILITDEQKELASMAGAFVTAHLMASKGIVESQAKEDGHRAVQDFAQLAGVNIDPEKVLSHTIQMQLDAGARLLQLAGFGSDSSSIASMCLFDIAKAEPSNITGLNRAWNSLIPKAHTRSYNSKLDYKDVAYDKHGLKLFVAGAMNGLSGASNPGLFIFNKECLLLKKIDFFGVDVRSVTVHPNNNWVVVGLASGTVKLVDVSSSNPDLWTIHATALLPTHVNDVEVVRFSQDGSRLVSAGKDKIVKVVNTSSTDPASWTQLCSGAADFNLSSISPGHILSAAFKGNDIIAVAHDGSTDITILNTATCTKTVIGLTSGHKAQSVVFNALGTQLAVTTDNFAGGDAVVEIYNTTDSDPANWTLQKTFTITGATKLKSATYHPISNYLAVADARTNALLRLFNTISSDPSEWSELSNSPLLTLSTTLGFCGVAWSKDGKNLTIKTAASEAIRFDTSASSTTEWSQKKQAKFHTDLINQVVCNPIGSLVATASDDFTINIWDAAGARQRLIASINATIFPSKVHMAAVTGLSWSSDGVYLFSAGKDDMLKVWNLSSGTPQFVQEASLSSAICSLASVNSGINEYLAAGLSDGSVNIIEFDRGSGSLTLLETMNEHTGPVNSLALTATGARLVTASDDGEVKIVNTSATIPGAGSVSLEGTLNAANLGGAWHSGAVKSVALSSDGTKVFSGGADAKVYISDISNPVLPLHRAVMADAMGSVNAVEHNGHTDHILAASLDGIVRLYDIDMLVSPNLIKAVQFPLGQLKSACWCNQGYDIMVAGQHGFGTYYFVNRFCIALAQQVAQELPFQDRARDKAKEIMSLIGISDTESTTVAQAVIDHLLGSPSDIAGATRVACNTFTTPLTGSELCDGTLAIIRSLDHPIDEAVSLTDLQGIDTALATASAQSMYNYLRCNPGDVSGAALLSTIYNKFCRAIAQVLASYSTDQARYLIQLVYPESTHPGLADVVLAAGTNALGSNPSDIVAVAQAICDEFTNQSITVSQSFCTALGKQLQNYMIFARQVADLSCMQSIGLTPSGSSGSYLESHRLMTNILDMLRPDPASVTNQAAAQDLCLGSLLVSCTPTPTESELQMTLLNHMNTLDITKTSPVQLAKDLRRTLESCDISGITIGGKSDPVQTSAIASALVGRMHAQKAREASLDVLDLAVAADMVHELVEGSLLPCGSLKNMRGDALQQASPCGLWGSSTSSLCQPFTTVTAYLDALAADVLTTTTGLIDATAAYTSLGVNEKNTIARAIVLRTLFCGDEKQARELFDGTANASYPAQIASLVTDIVTNGLTPSIGLSSLTLAGRQEIAVAALLFYDSFSPLATSAELQTIIAAGFAGASAAATLGDTSKEPFFALLSGLGAVAGFMQDRVLNPNSVDQQSTFDFIHIGSELAAGLIGDHMTVTDIGSSGYDGYAKDFSEPLLAAVAGGVVCESLSVILDEAVVKYGQFAVPLAYNQIFGDQVCKAIAKAVRDYDSSLTLSSSMEDDLLNSGLLPCGSLKNLRGDALDGTGPGGQWGSSTTILTGPFATLKAYLDALAADLASGLVATTYASSTADEKGAIVRAIVMRTLLCGNEQEARDLFDGSTNAAYPAQIASLVADIVTNGLTSSPGLTSLTLAGRQEIAVASLLFYDTFHDIMTSAELQAMIAAGFAGASSASSLGDSLKEAFSSFFSVLGTVGGFMYDRSINPAVADQKSVVSFITVAPVLAKGVQNKSVGASGYDGYAVDLTDEILTLVTGRMVCNGISVISQTDIEFKDEVAQLVETMESDLTSGTLLPCGSLQNMRGDALDGTGPGGQWGSSTTTLIGPFATLALYLDALAADVLTPTTGLIDATAAYTSLSTDEKNTIARAIVQRTLLCGDEQAARDLFDGTTNASYPAQIASLVTDIVSNGLSSSPGLSTLTLLGRQEVAVAALLFYDSFNPISSSAQLQAIIGSAFAGASAAASLGSTVKEPFFAFFSALGAAAGFRQDQSFTSNSSEQASVFEFIKMAPGMTNKLLESVTGLTGYDNYAQELASMALYDELADSIVCEAFSVMSNENATFYARLIRQIHQALSSDRCQSQDAIALGSIIGQFAGLTESQATAVATAALGSDTVQTARCRVCREFKSQFGGQATPTHMCTAMVSHVADVIQHPTSFKLDPFNYSLFGEENKGHVADVGVVLAQAGGCSQADSAQLGNELYDYLKDNPSDESGLIDLCQSLV